MPEREPQFFRREEPREAPGAEAEGAKKESELSSKEKELVLDIINHPLIQKGLVNYEIFSKYYSGEAEDKEIKELKKKGIKFPSRKEMKERADWVFSEETEKGLKKDPIYKIALKSERPVKVEDFLENEDFRKYVIGELTKEGINELKEAKEKGNFDEVLRKVFVDRQIDEAIKEAKEKGILTERIGDTWAEVINNECRPHLPRVAENWPKTFEIIKQSYKALANLLQKDERFGNVEKLTAITWLFGQKKIARDFDRAFAWHPYSEGTIKKLAREKSKEYQNNIQRAGIKASPKLFKSYLLTGEMPEIGGRWITKDEFIEKYEKSKE